MTSGKADFAEEDVHVKRMIIRQGIDEAIRNDERHMVFGHGDGCVYSTKYTLETAILNLYWSQVVAEQP